MKRQSSQIYAISKEISAIMAEVKREMESGDPHLSHRDVFNRALRRLAKAEKRASKIRPLPENDEIREKFILGIRRTSDFFRMALAGASMAELDAVKAEAKALIMSAAAERSDAACP